MRTLQQIVGEINRWQDTVFTRATPVSAAAHLKKEAQELWEDPYDEEEIADIFILLAGVAHLAGVDLEAAVEKKMKINRERTWGEPDAEGVVEHIRAPTPENFPDILIAKKVYLLNTYGERIGSTDADDTDDTDFASYRQGEE